MSRFCCVFLVVLAAVLSINSQSFAYMVDGNLSDWGVTPMSDLTPNAGVSSWVEDFTYYNGEHGYTQGYVGPGYGGQSFDAEAMYATVNSGKLYISMIVGMPPGGAYPVYGIGQPEYTGWGKFYPGDIALNLNGDSFYEYGLEISNISDDGRGGTDSTSGRKIGSLYNILNANGWRKGYSFPNPDYPNGNTYPNGTEVEINYSRNDSIQLVLFNQNDTPIELMYEDPPTTPTHYIVEVSIPLYKLQYQMGINWQIKWAQTCGNDVAQVQYLYLNFIPPFTPVPEPSTIIMLISCGIGLFIKRRK